MKPADAITLIANPASPPLEVLKTADELFSRNLIYINSGQQTSDELVQGVLHALVKVALQRKQGQL